MSIKVKSISGLSSTTDCPEFKVNSKGEKVYHVVPFEHNGLHMGLRCITIDGEPWFDVRHIAETLEYSRPDETLRQLKADFDSALGMAKITDKKVNFATVFIEGSREDRPKKLKVAREPAMFKLVLGSRKKEAIAFQNWICHEVLPAIRKQGGYINPDASSEQLQQLEDQVIDLQATIKLLNQDKQVWEDRAKDQREQKKTWEKRAHEQRDKATQWKEQAEEEKSKTNESMEITRDELEDVLYFMVRTLESSTFSGIEEQRAVIKRTLIQAPKKMNFQQFKFQCKKLFKEVAETFDIVDDHRCKGWTMYKNLRTKRDELLSATYIERLIEAQDGTLQSKALNHVKQLKESVGMDMDVEDIHI